MPSGASRLPKNFRGKATASVVPPVPPVPPVPLAPPVAAIPKVADAPPLSGLPPVARVPPVSVVPPVGMVRVVPPVRRSSPPDPRAMLASRTGSDGERPQARRRKSSAPMAGWSFNLWGERRAIPPNWGCLNRLVYLDLGHRWWFVVPTAITEIMRRKGWAGTSGAIFAGLDHARGRYPDGELIGNS
jgi:hypothetical protein